MVTKPSKARAVTTPRITAIVRMVVEESSVSRKLAYTIFEAHRTGRRDGYTYLKNFVLEKLGVLD